MDPSKNYVYSIDSTSPSPTGHGTIVEWLEYYKLDVHDIDHVYVSIPENTPELPKDDDTLWFQVDDRIVALVPHIEVRPDPINNRTELWYRGKDLVRLKSFRVASRGHRRISEETESWIKS